MVMGVGRGEGGRPWPLWILKMVVFLVSSGKKEISPLLASTPGNLWKNLLVGPPWKKSFRRP